MPAPAAGALAIIERLIEHGFKILPLKGKKPNWDILGPDGSVKHATANLKCISTWMARRVNLGATIPDSSIIHIDIDPRPGHRPETSPTWLPENTWAYVTGGELPGLHIFYRVPAGVTVRNQDLARGIEVLEAGLYGVIPPSVHPKTGNQYYWLKRWAIERDRLCFEAVEKAEWVRPVFLLGLTSARTRRLISGNELAYFHKVDQYCWRRMNDPDIRKIRAEFGGTAVQSAYQELYFRGKRRRTLIVSECRA